eukprot:2230311-Rhodomonas_salina.3
MPRCTFPLSFSVPPVCMSTHCQANGRAANARSQQGMQNSRPDQKRCNAPVHLSTSCRPHSAGRSAQVRSQCATMPVPTSWQTD